LRKIILASSSVDTRKQRRSFGTLARSPMLHPDQDRSACGWLKKKRNISRCHVNLGLGRREARSIAGVP